MPKLLDRDPYTTWERKGAKSMQQRVNERLQQILQTHQPTPLPEGCAKKIQAILKEAERRSASVK